MSIVIRQAERKDVPKLIKLIAALAEFENLAPQTKEAQDRFIEDGWPENGDRPKFTAWLAEATHPENGTKGDAAYAITFYTYSSFLARQTLYLEDLFVMPAFRRMGVATAMMKALVFEAKLNRCGRVEWVVLDWNVDAQTFYRKLGAEHQTEWQSYRMTLKPD